MIARNPAGLEDEPVAPFLTFPSRCALRHRV
jgi:hypothetical protein